jgi:predicted ATPase/DNA-binding winged helix-turn-helix (wHTH) protein
VLGVDPRTDLATRVGFHRGCRNHGRASVAPLQRCLRHCCAPVIIIVRSIYRHSGSDRHRGGPVRTDDRDNPRVNEVVSFGPFRLFASERLLKKDEQTIRLGGRALDILIALVERAGEVLTRRELISRVWSDVTVEEANLRVHVAGLRKALGDGHDAARYVVNVPGRGYCFAAPVTRSTAERSLPPAETPVAHLLKNLPARLTRMVGRDGMVRTISSELMMWRFVSIVGPGGIGKTTVAVAVAHMLAEGFTGAVFFIDLAPLTDPQLVPAAVASALGLMVQTRDPLVSLLALIGDREILLVLDTCEHVIDVAAPLAERLVSEAPHAHVLATSREALRVEGEHVHRLYALDCPPEDAALTAAEALRYPAVQLFMERAGASGYGAELTDAESPIVARVCRQLDGIPLAIELAASCVGSYGIHGTAELLNNRFGLLWQGRRAARPRHQTLNAMLDWSYSLLAEHEKVVLRRLSVLVGEFTLDAVSSVACETAADPVNVLAAVVSLIEKSLIATSIVEGSTYYRLLDTTRSYALKKLEQSGERDWLARRHAVYFRNLLVPPVLGFGSHASNEELTRCGRQIDNVRTALDWCFSASGDKAIGIDLTALYAPVWMGLSLLEECRGRTQRALRAFGTGESQDSREQMRLHAALGASTSDPSEMDAALMRTLEIARSLDDIEYQLRALRGLVFRYVSTNPDRALPHAQAFRDLAASRSDSHDRLFGECLIGAAKHYIGDQPGARWHLEQALSGYPPAEPGREIISFQDTIRFGTELWVMAHVWRGRVLWLQGLADQAVRAAETGVEEALATAHAPSLCYALGLGACQVHLWVGNLDTAEDHTRMLLDHSRKHGLLIWGELGAKFRSVINVKRDKFNSGPHLLPAGQDETFPRNFNYLLLLGEVTAACWPSSAGPWIDLSEACWLTPELFRLQGERLLAQKTSGAAEAAEQLFRRAQDEARRQGALSWELRAATSLAALLRGQGQPANAIACLQPIYDRFTEGFGTADLVAAKQLLDEPGAPDRG